MKLDQWHQCRRWELKGWRCPYHPEETEEEPETDHDPPFGVPGRRRKQPAQTMEPIVLLKALERLEQERAIPTAIGQPAAPAIPPLAATKMFDEDHSTGSDKIGTKIPPIADPWKGHNSWNWAQQYQRAYSENYARVPNKTTNPVRSPTTSPVPAGAVPSTSAGSSKRRSPAERFPSQVVWANTLDSAEATVTASLPPYSRSTRHSIRHTANGTKPTLTV